MKKLLLIVLSASLFAACNSDDKTVQKSETANEAKVKSAATIDPTAQKLDDLKKLAPVGLDELSAWLPGQLNGIKRNNLTMSSNMGYAIAHADYDKNSKTNMRVTVYDCAGSAGADLYKNIYLNKTKNSQEGEEDYTKTIDLMGGKAVEHHEKQNKITTLTYIAKNRILVVLSARNFEPEQVREAAEKLGTKQS
jgi:hypothetical protein